MEMEGKEGTEVGGWVRKETHVGLTSFGFSSHSPSGNAPFSPLASQTLRMAVTESHRVALLIWYEVRPDSRGC